MLDLIFCGVLCRRGLVAILMLLYVLACGLPASAPGVARAEQGVEPGDDGDHMPGRPAAWDVVVDSATVPTSMAGASVAAATD